MEETASYLKEVGRAGCKKVISQRTYKHSPPTQTTEWRWPEGRGQGLGGGGRVEGGNGDICNSVNNKNKEKKSLWL